MCGPESGSMSLCRSSSRRVAVDTLETSTRVYAEQEQYGQEQGLLGLDPAEQRGGPAADYRMRVNRRTMGPREVSNLAK